jgi:hypothetical protein
MTAAALCAEQLTVQLPFLLHAFCLAFGKQLP